jgi:hypothetical protein
MLYNIFMTQPANANFEGIYEIVVNVPQLAPAIEHWAALGYKPGQRGALTASQAQLLYGLAAAVESVRLIHGASRVGLIRLQQWSDPPVGPGLAISPLRLLGSRWSVHRAPDITPALAWGRDLQRVAGATINGPVVHSQGPAKASINHAVLTAHYRHVLMVRYGVDTPLYGTPEPTALLRCSAVCHAGIVVAPKARETLDFYRRLGFQRMSERRVNYDPESVATQMFPLHPGEALIEIDFDATRSRPGPGQLPGRLRAFVLESAQPQAAPITTGPGILGYSDYSIRHDSLPAPSDSEFANTCHALGAELLGRGVDEFGEMSARIRAPDGYSWLVLPISRP